MKTLLDRQPVKPNLTGEYTLSDLLDWVQKQLPPTKVITSVKMDGEAIDGSALTQSRATVAAGHDVSIDTSDRKELALTMLGKLAALIDWLNPQHRDVAAMLEKGDSGKALERLSGIISAWHQIQGSYGNLAKLVGITLKELPVREINGEMVMDEFCRQLGEIQTALANQDLVMLADILQYEMEGAVANWMSLLESTLAVIEPASLAA